jgi:hypothetical protein
VSVAQLGDLKGLVVTMDELGAVSAQYLGTDPPVNTVGAQDAKEVRHVVLQVALQFDLLCEGDGSRVTGWTRPIPSRPCRPAIVASLAATPPPLFPCHSSCPTARAPTAATSTSS